MSAAGLLGLNLVCIRAGEPEQAGRQAQRAGHRAEPEDEPHRRQVALRHGHEDGQEGERRASRGAMNDIQAQNPEFELSIPVLTFI